MRICLVVMVVGCWHGEAPGPVPSPSVRAPPVEVILDQRGVGPIRANKAIDLARLTEQVAPLAVTHDGDGALVIGEADSGIVVQIYDGTVWEITVRDPKVRTISGTRIGTRFSDIRERPLQCHGGPTEGDSRVYCAHRHVVFELEAGTDRYGGGAMLDEPEAVLRDARVSALLWRQVEDLEGY